MKALPTPLAGAFLLEPRVFGDERGWFCESWNESTLAGLGLTPRFVQDNHAHSRRGILRGLHWQVGRPQGKLVRCVHGAIFDVIVDLRRSSATRGRWFGARLDAQNRQQLWAPAGFAHGYLVLSDAADVLYKATDYWSKPAERGLRWDDPTLAIAWPDCAAAIEVNARDGGFPLLAEVPDEDWFP